MSSVSRRGSCKSLWHYSSEFLLAVLVLVLASGCATRQALNQDPRDPWEGFNRHVFAFNESVDIVVLRPIASAYKAVLPKPARQGVSNAFANLGELPSSLNNLLQGDLANSGNDILRFLINSTIGLLGLLDVASEWGIYRQQEDFGQTLAVWGVPPGPYLMLPLLGPASVRGVPGRIVDFLLSPLNWLFNSDTTLALRATSTISDREKFLEQEAILRSLSPDFYEQLKGFYLNRREHMARDGTARIDEDLGEMYEEL